MLPRVQTSNTRSAHRSTEAASILANSARNRARYAEALRVLPSMSASYRGYGKPVRRFLMNVAIEPPVFFFAETPGPQRGEPGLGPDVAATPCLSNRQGLGQVVPVVVLPFTHDGHERHVVFVKIDLSLDNVCSIDTGNLEPPFGLPAREGGGTCGADDGFVARIVHRTHAEAILRVRPETRNRELPAAVLPIQAVSWPPVPSVSSRMA